MSGGVLLPLLTRDRGPVRTFLERATGCDRPKPADLVGPGLARWDADGFWARLRDARELNADGAWNEQYRSAYREALATSDPVPPPRRSDLGRDGPREKARDLGIAALADHELLALLLRTGGAEGVLGLASRLLADHDGLVGLAGLDVADLVDAEGLGPAKAAEVAAAFELGRRLATAARRERPELRSPAAVAGLVSTELAALRHEELWCLALDPRCRLIGEPRRVSRGDIDGTDAGPRAFFRAALTAGAATAIAVHNHPTGDPSPSAGDRAVTRRLVAAGRLVGCDLDDHVVIGDGGRWASLRRDDPGLWAG